MKTAAYAAATLLALVLTLALLRTPDDAGRAATLEILAQPQTAAQMEAQRQAHEIRMAEIAARLADQQAEQATLRLAVILAAVVILAVLGAALWAALAMHSRHAPSETVILLPGTAAFDAALRARGGYWRNNTPLIDERPVSYLTLTGAPAGIARRTLP